MSLADLASAPHPTWTEEDTTFAWDIESAIGRSTSISPAAVSQWRMCSRAFGPRSAPALGCVLELVREAHWLPCAAARRVCIGVGSAESMSPPKGATLTTSGWVLYGWQVDDRDGWAIAGTTHTNELAALFAALEASPAG